MRHINLHFKIMHEEKWFFVICIPKLFLKLGSAVQKTIDSIIF